MAKLINLFDKLKLFAQQQNEIDSTFDGLTFWKSFKPILNKYEEYVAAGGWEKEIMDNDHFVMNGLPEYNVYRNKEKEIIPHNHFIIQTYRIPLISPPNIKRILQIALNIGQCLGKGSKYNKYLVDRKHISDYISEKDIETLGSMILDEDIDQICRCFTK